RCHRPRRWTAGRAPALRRRESRRRWVRAYGFPGGSKRSRIIASLARKRIIKRRRAAPWAASSKKPVLRARASKIAGTILDGDSRPVGLGAEKGPSNRRERFAPT